MADMQAGIGPFLGVFLLAHGWQTGVDRLVAGLRIAVAACLRTAPSFARARRGSRTCRRSAMMIGVNAATWGIAGLATFGVIARPWNLPEFIWAVAGTAVLVLLHLLPWSDALAAAAKGTDVYFFLIGMMLLAEAARKEGLFDWLAAQAVQSSTGSAKRL